MRSVLLCLALLPPILTTPPVRADDPLDFSPVSEGGNKVDGLTLPADMKVPADSGLVKIRAVCDGVVKFSVLGSVAGVRAETAGKTVVISVPPTPGAEIVVFAWTVVVKKSPDGQIVSTEPSELARCTITVDKPVDPAPQPAPPPSPAPAPGPKLTGQGYAVLIYDAQSVTAESAAVLNSAKFRALPNLSVKTVDGNDPWLKTKNLTGKFGALPWIVVQDAKGSIVASQRLPATEDDAIALIQKLRGQ